MKITIFEALRIARVIEQARAECEQHRNTRDPVLKRMLQNLQKTADELETMIGKILLELRTQASPDE